MEAFYKLLDWLTMDQAIDRLNTLTKTKKTITDAGLMQLCAAGKCSAFINTALANRTDCEFNQLLFEATGYHQLLNADQLARTLGGMGHYMVKATGRVNNTETTWSGLFPVFDYGIHFKSTDIQALAAQMHDSSDQPCVSEPSSCQLEQERAIRLHAEAEEGRSLFRKHTKILALYRQLDWLNLEQALDWIWIISGVKVESHFLYAMAEFENRSMHTDGRGRQGYTNNKDDSFKLQEVLGVGYCQVTTPAPSENENIYLSGPTMPLDGNDSSQISFDCSWWIDSSETFEPAFKPAEIEALAKMVKKDGSWSNSSEKDRHWSHALRGVATAEETRAYVQHGDATDVMHDSNGQPSHVNEFDSSLAEHDLSGATADSVATYTPKLQRQEESILKALEKLGRAVTALPPNPPGKRTDKTDIRDALLKTRNDLFMSRKTFDSAWARLMADGRVAYQASETPSP